MGLLKKMPFDRGMPNFSKVSTAEIFELTFENFY